MLLQKTSNLFSNWLSDKNIIFNKVTAEKVLYLTFDDGPSPEITPFIIENLKIFKAEATFFCVGDNIKKYPESFNKLIEAGHKIGNHTYNHLNGWKTEQNKYIYNIELFNKEYQTNIFRPPYGKITLKQLNIVRTNYKIIFWSILSYDFDKTVSREKCLSKVITQSKKGSIIVFHDNQKAESNLYYSLPRTLEFFSEKGFTFKKLDF
ncbi:MAG: polysaccharide deacetylase family protein [Bacteroidales bacterium]|nr:polysaccharide deacetylase family protein [Bacteroidales bacterium]